MGLEFVSDIKAEAGFFTVLICDRTKAGKVNTEGVVVLIEYVLTPDAGAQCAIPPAPRFRYPRAR